MATSRNATINGHPVEGQAHIQPGINHWIGVFFATEAILTHISRNWQNKPIDYEGPFQCGKRRLNGMGKAHIIYMDTDKQKGRVTIHLQGIDKADLEEKLEQDLPYGYNANLPAFEVKKPLI